MLLSKRLCSGFESSLRRRTGAAGRKGACRKENGSLTSVL
jgi:hypothetical protein